MCPLQKYHGHARFFLKRQKIANRRCQIKGDRRELASRWDPGLGENSVETSRVTDNQVVVLDQ